MSKKLPLVFLDVSIDGDSAEKMVFELFSDVAPKTAENFCALYTGEKGISPKTGRPLHYKGSFFHSIIKGSMAQMWPKNCLLVSYPCVCCLLCNYQFTNSYYLCYRVVIFLNEMNYVVKLSSECPVQLTNRDEYYAIELFMTSVNEDEGMPGRSRLGKKGKFWF
ncbi:hypothetical protein CsSME_00036172 [Camellia sinensis var. sinensis]